MFTRVVLIFALLAIFNQMVFAQKTEKEKSTFISTSLNYHNATKPILFTSAGNFVTIENEYQIPSPRFNLGLSFQIRNKNSVFHEISLSRLSISKTSYRRERFVQGQGFSEVLEDYENKNTTLGLRYEFGKIFGGEDLNRLRFGVSGAIEPTLFYHQLLPDVSQGFPLSAKKVVFEFSIIPFGIFNISKCLNLDFKIIPTMYLGELGYGRIMSPNLTLRQQRLPRSNNFADLSIKASIHLRYTLGERTNE